MAHLERTFRSWPPSARQSRSFHPPISLKAWPAEASYLEPQLLDVMAMASAGYLERAGTKTGIGRLWPWDAERRPSRLVRSLSRSCRAAAAARAAPLTHERHGLPANTHMSLSRDSRSGATVVHGKREVEARGAT
jgi:hypothetical protein